MIFELFYVFGMYNPKFISNVKSRQDKIKKKNLLEEFERIGPWLFDGFD